jgi:predicted TPR repeat methyltransferase
MAELQPLTLNRAGEAALANKQPLEALALFDRALALAPELAAALDNRGRALRLLGRPHEAIDAHSRALALQPGLARAYVRRARCRQDIGENQAAQADYRAALELRPDRHDWALALGLLLADAGEHQAAIAELAPIAQHGDCAPAAAFVLASLQSRPPPPAPPPAYVAALFDSYAARFERHLVRRLKYRAPQLLADAVLPLLRDGSAHVVDLGCGTGLMGTLLRPAVQWLEGIDLSPAMIEQAAAKKLYDRLETGELVGWLESRAQSFDAAIAADVFVYLGDLSPVFAALRRALRGEGFVAFTVEALDEGDFRLLPTRRYAHSRRYVEATAQAHGFVCSGMTRQTLRRNGEEEISGYVAVFRRRARA